MKNKIKECFAIILCIAIISNSITFNVIASNIDPDENDTLFKDWEIVEGDESDLEIIKKNIPSYIQFILTQVGVTMSDLDVTRTWDDTGKWFDEHRSKMVVVKNKKTGQRGIRVKKGVTDVNGG